MHRSERDQCLASTAFRDDHRCPRLLPALGDSHNGDGLCRERRSQQSFNPRGNCIVELVERWILLQNALSQKRRVTAHVVVDRGEFWHGSPLVRGGFYASERENKKRKNREKKEDGWCGRLVGRQKEVCETKARPADRTCRGGNSNRFTLDAPAKPVEKLFFLAFNNHWITSDAKRGHDRPVRFQFAGKPVSPFRHSGDPVNMSDGGPDESVFRACQQRSSRTRRYVTRGEFFRQCDEVAQGFLAPGQLHRAFETLCISFETYPNRL